MLDKQIHLYSVDTGHFYSNHEKYLHDMNYRYRSEKNYISHQLPEYEKRLKTFGYSEQDIKCVKTGHMDEITVSPDSAETVRQYRNLLSLIAHKRAKAKEAKEKLAALISNKVNQNELTGGKDHIRRIRENSLGDTNIISVFDSALSRTIGIGQDELTDALIVVQVYYFDVFKDLSFYGFLYQKKKYRYFTSSAGQIRKKKAVFIEETVWNRIETGIMCGLTIDKINSRGGNNVNKHLAYMALANSATDEWKEFDIGKTIVIDDFETNVFGTFDFIDESDYSITRKNDFVPVTHTDGAGMMLPDVSDRNFMFRAPWIKGLLGVFDFRKFIELNRCSPVITDIYGKEHDVIREDIRIIFTKSQFKMYRYYDSWEEYQSCFRKYGCGAGRCNMEERRIKNAKINYQMLQTLTDITEDEIDLLTGKSSEKLKNICQSQETMLNVLGVTPYNTNPTPFQKALRLYPALLGDSYAKDVLRDVKDSLVKKYRSGKLEVVGKYTFLLPDYYAACEYWFGHREQPEGLLADQEVYCRLFPRFGRLDCLRSPHLYREHAIRINTAVCPDSERGKTLSEWFTTDAIYTSSYDLISKILQFDVDGDKSLVVADPDFVRIAERNMKGIAPLYYNMRKAAPTKLNSRTIYEGLNAAFTGGNIGVYSNDISKIWNHSVFVNGTDEQRQEAIDAVKLLCCENNFVIDYAKTLYKPKRPDDKNALITKYTRAKLPAFFEFAKDKDPSQIEERNQSFVNKIYSRIPNLPINTRGLKLGAVDYRLLMNRPEIVCSREVSSLHDELNKKYRFMINMKDESIDNLRYTACTIRARFQELGYSDETVSDMLVQYLYGMGKRYKQLLWFCYGSIIVQNLERNLPAKKTKCIQCTDCGEWFEVPANNGMTCRCAPCLTAYKKERDRLRKQKYRLSHEVSD